MNSFFPSVFLGLRISLPKSVRQFLEPAGIFERHRQFNRLNKKQAGIFFSQNFNLWRDTRFKSKPGQYLFADLIDSSNGSFIKTLSQRMLAATI